MNKIMIFILILIMSISLFGCYSNGGEDISVLKSLKDEKIVDKDLELIDEVTDVYTVNGRQEYIYSIYENDDAELVAIFYENKSRSNTDYDYVIRIYTDVTVNEVEYIDDTRSLDQYYEYKDGKKSETNKYDMYGMKEYYAYKKDPMSGMGYEFEEAE